MEDHGGGKQSAKNPDICWSLSAIRSRFGLNSMRFAILAKHSTLSTNYQPSALAEGFNLCSAEQVGLRAFNHTGDWGQL